MVQLYCRSSGTFCRQGTLPFAPYQRRSIDIRSGGNPGLCTDRFSVFNANYYCNRYVIGRKEAGTILDYWEEADCNLISGESMIRQFLYGKNFFMDEFVVPFHIRHLGPRQSIVLDCGSKFNDVVNEPLPKSIILAHQYAQMLESGRYSTVLELAKALKLDRSYVARTLSLVNLAPDIIVAVMQGKTPPQMTLAKAVNNLPEDWQEQRELFGMSS